METAKGKVTLESGRLAHNKLFTGERYYDSSYLETFWKHCFHGNFMGIGGELEGNYVLLIFIHSN